MSVPVQTPSKEYIANGTTTAFPLEFNCDKAEYLIVTLNGEEAPVGSWTLANDTVTFNVAPLNGVVVNLERNTPFQRTTNYQLYDNSFRPSAVNKDFDLIWWKLQELGYRDQVIWLALVKEIADRTDGDEDLQNQINTIDDWLTNLQQNVNENTNDIAQLVNDLSKEIADRITGDQILKDMFISMIDEAINEGTINALAITHLDSLEDLEEISNVWDGRTIYVKDLGNYRYDALTTSWVKAYQDADNVIDGQNTQKEINDKTVLTFKSIADLLAYTPRMDGQIVYVESYIAGKNKGGDSFEYNSSRALENDGISVFNGWVRIFSVPYVTFYHGGAYGDYVTDDEVAIERSLKYARDNGRQVFVAGNFAKSKPFILRSNDYVVGSRLNSRIKKITNQTSGLPDILAPEKTDVYDVYDVDALCIFLPWSGYYADNIVLRDIMFVRGTYGVDTPSSYGFYAPRHSSCETLNLRFDNVLTGFLAKNLFLNKHTNFSSVGAKNTSGNVSVVGMNIYDGENVQTGTSNTFERFLLVNYQQGYFISNLQTSEFTCCYGEAISKSNGFDDTSVFFVNNPYELSFNQCGLESSYGTPMYVTGTNPNIRSKVSITGWQSRWGANGTLTDRGLNLLTIAGSVDVTTDSASFVKGSEGFINDFAYITDGARLINLGSQLGSAATVVSNGAKLFDLYKSMYEGDGGLIKSTKDVGSDLNNGIEWTPGVVHKLVKGATLNIPGGLTDCWGTSTYYGLNASEGVQVLHLTNSNKTWRRTVLSPSNIGAWE
ncbi:hypothetical protein [Acinetobacter baumannii]|uniref:hypothetical protein n=1 Tax=Acinetobacter baumannii TaxID=470 RepID=UPI001D0CEE90|nr:hypothetical protein [Acinetobacter baumannii]